MRTLILITDSNFNDVYVSVLKHRILSTFPNFYIFEYFIPHTHNNLNSTAAYILLNEHNFSPSTLFYVEINTPEKILHQKILLIQYNQKWILTPDNGILGLLEKNKIQKIYEWKEHIQSSFYSKNEMLNALKNIVQSEFKVSTDFIEREYTNCKRINWPSVVEKSISATEKRITLPILYIDSYNNIILLFHRSDYEKYTQQYDISIKLPLGDTVFKIAATYNEENFNELVAIFNDAGYLEIALNGSSLAPLIANKDIYHGTSYPILLVLKQKQKEYDKTNSQNELSAR